MYPSDKRVACRTETLLFAGRDDLCCCTLLGHPGWSGHHEKVRCLKLYPKNTKNLVGEGKHNLGKPWRGLFLSQWEGLTFNLRGRKHIIVMGCVLQGLVTMLLSVIDSKLGSIGSISFISFPWLLVNKDRRTHDPLAPNKGWWAWLYFALWMVLQNMFDIVKGFVMFKCRSVPNWIWIRPVQLAGSKTFGQETTICVLWFSLSSLSLLCVIWSISRCVRQVLYLHLCGLWQVASLPMWRRSKNGARPKPQRRNIRFGLPQKFWVKASGVGRTPTTQRRFWTRFWVYWRYSVLTLFHLVGVKLNDSDYVLGDEVYGVVQFAACTGLMAGVLKMSQLWDAWKHVRCSTPEVGTMVGTPLSTQTVLGWQVWYCLKLMKRFGNHLQNLRSSLYPSSSGLAHVLHRDWRNLCFGWTFRSAHLRLKQLLLFTLVHVWTLSLTSQAGTMTEPPRETSGALNKESHAEKWRAVFI